MPRIGLRALGVDLSSIKDMTIGEIFGSGIISVPEFNKKFWQLIKERNLKVKLQVTSEKTSPIV